MFLSACVAGCAKHDRRGWSTPSADGQTYLVIDDNNGGDCGAITVDGREWVPPIHVPGLIAPGGHVIACGHLLETVFEVESGMTYHFRYWGP
jgi:hypothetical protein